MKLRKGLVALGVVAVLLSASVSRAKEKSKEDVAAGLASPDFGKVYDALQAFEKSFADDAELRQKALSLLGDSRPKVKRKAARVFGALGAKLSAEQLRQVQSLLASSDKDTVIDGLKALRGLENRNDFAPVLPLLQSPDANVKRDSCRTLAVIADKSVIPKIEPLLNDPDKKVRQDAEEAIGKLKTP
jgi:HEAT repeat protein